jgi:hypothetical protein
MVLKDTLQKHNVPLPPDFDERMDLLVSALKRSPSYPKKLASFKAKRGGADASTGEDWLGPRLNSFVDAVTSPEARGAWMSLFAVVFFIKYLEATPVFGSILSATLDVMLAGGKMAIKSVQKLLPPMIGLIPLPYASMVGLAMAALFGMIVWPIIGLVSLSRADFTASIESFIRVIPPPMGDMIADLFLEGNRGIARIEEKREKLVSDLSAAFTNLSEIVSASSENLQQGFQDLKRSLPQPTGGKRLSRRTHRNKKWKTRRNKFARYYESG